MKRTNEKKKVSHRPVRARSPGTRLSTFIADRLKHSSPTMWGPEAVAFTCHHDPNTVFYPPSCSSDLYGTPNNYTPTPRAASRTGAFRVPDPLRPRLPDARFRQFEIRHPVGHEQSRREPGPLGKPRPAGRQEDAAASWSWSTPISPRRRRRPTNGSPMQPRHRRRHGARHVQGDHRQTISMTPISCSNHCEGFNGFRDHLNEKHGYTAGMGRADHRRGRRKPLHAPGPRVRQLPSRPCRRSSRAPVTTPTAPTPAAPAISSTPSPARWTSPAICYLKDWAPLGRAGRDIPDEAKRCAKTKADPLHVAMGYPLAPDLPNARLPDAVINGDPYPVKAPLRAVDQPGDERSRTRDRSEGNVRTSSNSASPCELYPERDGAGMRHRAAGNLVLRAGGDPPGHVARPRGRCCASRRWSRASANPSRPMRSSRASPRKWAGASISRTRSGRTGASS